MSLSAQLRADADDVWAAQHAHPVVRGIGDGTLPEAAFREYVRQDFVFLVDYGRVLSLGAARAPRLAWMERFAALASETLSTELALHRSLARSWGIADELGATVPAAPTRAYIDYLLRVGALGDFAELAAAVLPCMWGYSEIGARLAAAGAPAHEGYAAWIATYASDEFQALAAWAREVVDAVGAETGDAGRERMAVAFRTCSQLELGFWDVAGSAGA